MDGSGLFQVLVTLAVVVLAVFWVVRSYRKPGQDAARAEGEPDSQNETMTADAATKAQAEASSARPAWVKGDGWAILKRAWALFCAHYWRLTLLFAAVAAIGAALIEAASLLPLSDNLLMICLALIPLMLLPLTATGASNLALSVWRGEKPSFSQLAAFLPVRRYFRAIWLQALQALALLLPGFGLFIGLMILLESMFGVKPFGSAEIVAVTMILLATIGMAWIALRMSLSHFALAKIPELPAGLAFSYGYRATKGHLMPILGIALASGWPMAAAALLAQWMRKSFGWPAHIADWLPSLAYALIGGYAWISMAGLAEKLLAGEDTHRPDGEEGH